MPKILVVMLPPEMHYVLQHSCNSCHDLMQVSDSGAACCYQSLTQDPEEVSVYMSCIHHSKVNGNLQIWG